MGKIIDRVILFAKENNISMRQLGLSLGASEGYISSIKRSGSNIGGDHIENIAREYPALNLEWLIKGEGEMLHSDLKKENIASEDQTIYEKKEPKKQIEDVAYGIHRRFDDVERALKILMLDVSEVKLKADAVDTNKITKALDDLGVLKDRV